jgi:hypothetical protein
MEILHRQMEILHRQMEILHRQVENRTRKISGCPTAGETANVYVLTYPGFDYTMSSRFRMLLDAVFAEASFTAVLLVILELANLGLAYIGAADAGCRFSVRDLLE